MSCWRTFSMGLIVFAMIDSAVLLIYFGLTIVKPYRYTLDFKDGLCMAIDVTDHGFLECDCGEDDVDDCTSVYPCEEIKIAYVPEGASTMYHASLFQEYSLLKSERKCATAHCSSSVHENNVTVATFVKKYGKLFSSYQCLYNPVSWDEVILWRPTKISVIMAMLWKSLVIVVANIFILVLLCRPLVFSFLYLIHSILSTVFSNFLTRFFPSFFLFDY